MKFNWLLSLPQREELCEASTSGKKQHFYVPAGVTKATAGTEISALLECTRCSRTEWVYITPKQFEEHKNLFSPETN